MPTTSCCPACTRPSTSRSARRSATSRCRRPRSPTTPTATPSIVVDDKGKDADGKPQLVGAPDLRHDRRDARRPGRVLRRQGGEPSSPPARSSCTTARRWSINNTVSRPTTPTRRRSTSRAAAPAMNFTDIFIRRPVLATVVSLMILVLGLRAVGVAADPAISAHRERHRHRDDHLLRRRSRRHRRLHHHAAGECHRAGQRHRLHDARPARAASARSPSICGSTTMPTRR